MSGDVNTQRPILIVDSLNLFVRCYNAFPTMSTNGYQVGGTVGFLKTLRKIVDESQPRAIYIAWEGGGSSRRRALYADYKMNRRPEKLNRFYEDDIPDSEENKQDQIKILLSLLKNVPACQLYVSDCEADDLIAHLCCNKFKNDKKIIASSDKDMYQLLDQNTKIYSLHKKIYVGVADIMKEFRVTAKNFALAKALCGDTSDNIPGVKGMGFKTVAKLFPILGSESDVILQDVFSYCSTHLDESKMYQRVIDATNDIKRNWRLIHLDGSMLASNQLLRIDNAISTFKPTVNKLLFMRKLIDEGINDFNLENFFYAFNCIEGLEHK